MKEQGLERFARVFVDAGFVVLVHDHRGSGASGGDPRFDVDPSRRRIAYWRHAISYLESHPAVDPRRIGVWGTSCAGGHAIVLGTTDRRPHAMVFQVPTTSGYQQSLRRVPLEQLPVLEASFVDDDRRQFRGFAGLADAAADDRCASRHRHGDLSGPRIPRPGKEIR